MQNDSVVIVGMARTPQGKLLGTLKDLSGNQLGTIAIKAAMARAGIQPSAISEVLMGCVLPAGQGQAPARQAALNAGLPPVTSCTTINKVCGSGMKTVMIAHDALATQNNAIFIAGGMESMSNAPYLLLKARQGYRLGHSELIDHMQWDGLEDAYDRGRSMGYFAEIFAKDWGFSRKEQDEYAMRSLLRAQDAIRDNKFSNEITPVTISSKQGDSVIQTDEHPGSVKIEKIPLLQPAFMKDGTITAANSSSIADGAAAVVLMRAENAEKQGIKPLARIVSHSSFGKKPEEFTSAPIDAIRHLMTKIGWTMEQVDLFEINEAFAVVTLAAMRELKIPAEKLNIHGGGCALGHPIGATGTRIIVTLIAALQQYGLKRGIASLCIGGGEATAIAIEIL
ncbi:MAG: acetyl-CoA C-acyltransferase [Gammaproteobacteria bacterium]|nr:acetyl-CoA C-acyltransferase [Gammaproteobacteria bacterium]